MKQRKYTGFTVARHVAVSSTGHYSFSVTFYDGSKRVSRWYDYGILHPLRRKYPAYVIDAIEAKIVGVLEAGASFYEHDRDGNARYEGLRYHEPGRIPHMIQSLRKDKAA